MSNLGLRILYEILNERPDALAERCFAPDADLSGRLRSTGTPLWRTPICSGSRRS